MKKVCCIEGCGKPFLAKGLCRKHYTRQWYKDNPDQLEKARVRMSHVPREVMRDRALRYAYGVDSAWYVHQLAKQNGVCAICHKPESKTINGKLLKLAVDHCHDTLKVRGLLCQACNRGIGCFNHDMAILHAAIHYLNITQQTAQVLGNPQPTDS